MTISSRDSFTSPETEALAEGLRESSNDHKLARLFHLS